MGTESHVEIWAMALAAGEVVIGKVSRCRTEMSCVVRAVQTCLGQQLSLHQTKHGGGETAGQSQQHGALQEVDLTHPYLVPGTAAARTAPLLAPP